MTYRFDMQKWVDRFANRVAQSERVLSGDPRFDSRKELRLDAGETMALSRQLEALLSETFDVEQPPLDVFRHVPVFGKAPAGAETLTYQQYERFGQAKRVERWSDDLPLVNAQATSDTRRLFSFADAYELSFQDLRAAAMGMISLDATLASAARRAIEEAMSAWALFGDAAAAGGTVTNVYGFLNLDATGAAYITPVTPITGSWASATPEQIIADIALLWNEVRSQTKGAHRANTLLIPGSMWGYVSQARTYTDLSPKDWCQRNLDGLQTIEPWDQLDLADSAGTGPRMVAFEKNRAVGWLEMPMDIMFHSPQERNLSYLVPVEARFGGFICPRPLGVSYMDGL